MNHHNQPETSLGVKLPTNNLGSVPATLSAKPHWYQRLKKRWGVKSDWQALMIFITFGCAGPSVLYVKDVIWYLIGNPQSIWLKVVLYPILIFPTYQVLLLMYAFIFGQFKFFYRRWQKLGQRVGRYFSRAFIYM
ncbi:MAG TPA: hypothetical protein DCS93_01580 [Microscillaceae bacterium]|nr:hypothetical protein [Microscillaceae bacterium]